MSRVDHIFNVLHDAVHFWNINTYLIYMYIQLVVQWYNSSVYTYIYIYAATKVDLKFISTYVWQANM